MLAYGTLVLVNTDRIHVMPFFLLLPLMQQWPRRYRRAPFVCCRYSR